MSIVTYFAKLINMQEQELLLFIIALSNFFFIYLYKKTFSFEKLGNQFRLLFILILGVVQFLIYFGLLFFGLVVITIVINYKVKDQINTQLRTVCFGMVLLSTIGVVHFRKIFIKNDFSEDFDGGFAFMMIIPRLLNYNQFLIRKQ